MKYVLAGALVAATSAAAEPCPPTVSLDGDPALVVTLHAELADRGIAFEGACPGRAARIERRGDALVVSIAEASRTVHGIPAAAAVIESFVRDDVGLPLLASRPVDRGPATVARSEVAPGSVPRGAPTGVHLFAGFETSVANDGTNWIGAQLGACVMLGPLCVGARAHATTVKDNKHPDLRRQSAELLFGIDVPFSLGRFLLMPGVAAGNGELETKSAGNAANRSNNLRAEAHASVAMPLTRSFAIELSVVGSLVQLVQHETGYMDTVPPEPSSFLRFGLALRYGRR